MKKILRLTVVSLGLVVAVCSCTDDQDEVMVQTNKEGVPEVEVKYLDTLVKELPFPDELLPIKDREIEMPSTEIKKEYDDSSKKLIPATREMNRMDTSVAFLTKGNEEQKGFDMGIMRDWSQMDTIPVSDISINKNGKKKK